MPSDITKPAIKMNKVFPSLFCLLCAVFVLMLSCSVKKVELPLPEHKSSLEDILARKADLSVSSIFDIEFERSGRIVKGEAALQLTPDLFDLRVYSLGFLVAEVRADKTGTISNPPIDRDRLSVLVDGLRNSFLWWSVKDHVISDSHDNYEVSNTIRRLVINKKTMLPVSQEIELGDGRLLHIRYDEPAIIEGVWFPSKLKAVLSNYSVRLKIKNLTFNPSGNSSGPH